MARGGSRGFRVWAVVAVVISGVLTGVGFDPATADVTAVKGSAFGLQSHDIVIFGGPQPQTGPLPTVALPAGGSSTPVTGSAPTGLVKHGPATLFSSGALNVSTQGTTGAGGMVTSSATISNINTSTQEVFTAASVSSSCTASESSTTGTTGITGGTLIVSEGPNIDIDSDDVIVQIPATPAPNTEYTGKIETVGDTFRMVFNEQITNADGSITVNAAHQYLLGPTATGDLIIAQSVCGVIPPAATTTSTTGATTSTTRATTSTTRATTTTTRATTTTQATTTSSTAATTTTSTTAATTTTSTTAASTTTSTTTAGTPAGVSGGAYGFYVSVGLFGGAAATRGPAPTVELPAGGSATPVTASAPTGDGKFGPAIIFSSGKLDVSTQGTPGGTVTSSSNVENVNSSGQEVFTAALASSTCSAAESGASGSTTITGGSLITSEGANIDIDEDDVKVQIPASPGVNTEYTGKIETVGDTFRLVFNEQVASGGSITVNAAHLYLLGPVAVGELIIGQSRCGRTAATSGGSGGGGGGGAQSAAGAGGSGLATTGGAFAVFVALAMLLVIGGWSTMYWAAGARWREPIARRMPWAVRGLLR